MKILYFLIFALVICGKVFSSNVFESSFFNIEVETLNANESKENSINNVKHISFLKLMDKILNDEYRKKINKIIGINTTYDLLIKNIIIENEIITDEKYIARIKINYEKEKIVNFLRNNSINYTDLESDPFLLVATYNINFDKIGLDKKNSFNNLLKYKVENNSSLIKYFFPNLDSNDRYILPYDKIINEDVKAFDQFLNKYKLSHLIIINFTKLNEKNKIDITIKIYDNKAIYKIGKLNYNDLHFNTSDKLYNFLFDETLLFISKWWKKKYQINNNKFDIINCNINAKNFNELIKINTDNNNLSQVKNVNKKKIKINSNSIEIYYYGNLDILIKSLSSSNNLYINNNECIITAK